MSAQNALCAGRYRELTKPSCNLPISEKVKFARIDVTKRTGWWATIAADVLTTGAAAVKAADVVQDVEALITSIPLHRMPGIKPLVADLSRDAVIIGTSNYYPARDGHVQALEEGQVESLWVAEQLGRAVVKAWNAIPSGTFDAKGAPAGDTNRLAIPVAADDDAGREIAMTLVEETGFDAVDAGSLADSWRLCFAAPALA